jgi:surfactin synthase thioesterase subunit
VNWFVIPRPRPQAAVRLFCLPYAGAGASAYRRWPAAMGADIEVIAVQPPGRENRIAEDAAFDRDDLAAAIATQIAGDDRPYALYGHSLGGWDAYEVTRHLHRTGSPLPVKLYTGGCRAPHIPVTGTFAGLSTLDDNTLVARIAQGGGLHEAILAEPELVELLLPALRADFTRLDQYTHTHGDPLPVPIVAYAARADTAVTVADIQPWDRHTTAGATVHEVDGDHFFLLDDNSRVTDLITKDLLSALPGRPS